MFLQIIYLVKEKKTALFIFKKDELGIRLLTVTNKFLHYEISSFKKLHLSKVIHVYTVCEEAFC